MKKNRILLFAMLIGSSICVAQQSRMLTLDEAVEMGIAHSKYLKIDAAKELEAKARYESVKNNFLPNLKVSGSALAIANSEVNIEVLFKNPNAASIQTPKPNSAYFGQANLSLPLFAGGSIRYGIKSAEYLVKAQELSTENDKNAMAYNIAQAYNNLFKASQTIKVLEENLKVAQDRDKHFLSMENNGLITRNDRLKANLQTSNIELQLLDAQNNYSIANMNMDLLLGLPDDTKIEVDPNYTADEKVYTLVQDYVAEAMQYRKDLQAVQYQLKAAGMGKKAAKGSYYPQIALTAGYTAAKIPKIFSIYNAANIGIGVQYNLDNLWKKNTSLEQAKAQEQALQSQSELTTEQIRLEVNRDYQNAILANKKISVYEKTMQQAAENYRITKNKFDNGLATMTELLEADAAQISANVGYVNAKADAALAYKKLMQTIGKSVIF
ncbi:TolC family protein [Riemerella columbipharyngis]|uniref:Outer membrane protein TolC n=1 Tax=Riemerella columbipharyngis TaxID=1071918 RepID=A0A1G7EDC6_9FLAO|nr:TolC family protein [Riemerella columbipharyngis]SDE61688.1 Outer membrane protein TolC [Riemerella columbipharyngis]